jgi:hypothetical protein
MTALLSLISFLAVALVHAQTTGLWTGTNDGNWNNAANWTGGGVPNATDAIAQFGSGSTTTNVNLDTAVSLTHLDFLSGAAAHAISTSNASTLTITRSDTNAYISNAATGVTQTISANIELTRSSGTTFYNSLVANSALTLTGQLRAATGNGNRDVVFQGDGIGGTVNINGTFSNLTSLRASNGATVNYNPTSGTGLSNIWADANGRINILANPLSARTFTLVNGGASIFIKRTGTTNIGDINMRGTGGGVKTFGADLENGQSATLIVSADKKINLNHTASATNTTYRFSSNANTTFIIDGEITEARASSTGTKIEIAGGGAVRFSGIASNTFSTTPVVVSAGRLELNKTDGATAIASGSSLTVNQGAELRLLNSHQIADDVTLTLAGGEFNIAGNSDTLGALTIGASGGSLRFSGSGSVTFASLAALDGTLTVYGWTPSASIVFTDTSDWNETTLAQVVFEGIGQGAMLDGGKLVSATVVPEPATWVLLTGMIILVPVLLSRRRSQDFAGASQKLDRLRSGSGAGVSPASGSGTGILARERCLSAPT